MIEVKTLILSEDDVVSTPVGLGVMLKGSNRPMWEASYVFLCKKDGTIVKLKDRWAYPGDTHTVNISLPLGTTLENNN